MMPIAETIVKESDTITHRQTQQLLNTRLYDEIWTVRSKDNIAGALVTQSQAP